MTQLGEQPPLSQVQRVLDTFVAPTKTFRDILRSSSWWLPLLLVVISSAVSSWAMERQVGFDRIAANMVHSMPAMEERLSGASPEQRATAMRSIAARTRYGSYLSPLTVAALLALYALLLWGGFSFALGATVTYQRVLATVLYASLPLVISGMILVLTLLLNPDPGSFDVQNPVGTNPGYYLSGIQPWLRTLLGRLDLIRLWSLALTTVGMAIVSRKSYTQAAVVVLGLWLLTTAGAVAIAALTS